MTRIVCVGSRIFAEDAAGARVHDLLAASALPEGVELVDGGLRGIDLLPSVEGADRVVFVDAVAGGGAEARVVVLDRAAAAAAAPPRCDHAAGLAYLLRCLPAVVEGRVPEVVVVGVEGSRPDERTIEEAAARALSLATPEGEAP